MTTALATNWTYERIERSWLRYDVGGDYPGSRHWAVSTTDTSPRYAHWEPGNYNPKCSACWLEGTNRASHIGIGSTQQRRERTMSTTYIRICTCEAVLYIKPRQILTTCTTCGKVWQVRPYVR